MKSKLIDIEIGLLLLKYSKKQILDSLGRAEGINEAELIQELKSYKVNRSQGKKAREDVFSKAVKVIKNSKNFDLLEKFAHAYHNKTWLGSTRDVKLFLAKAGIEQKHTRSSAVPIVFKILLSMTDEELEREYRRWHRIDGDSSFGRLSDEIIKNRIK